MSLGRTILCFLMAGAVASSFTVVAATAATEEDAQAVPKSPERPNVIWILLDACRADHLSCYGYARPTSPNIDRLAEDGVLFERTIAQANITILSVPSMLTGRYFPVSTFYPIHWQASSRNRPEDERYLSEILREHGYVTAVLSAHPGINTNSQLSQAFDRCQRVGPDKGWEYGPFNKLNKVLFKWLEEFREKPFFVYVHALETHQPYCIHEGHDQWVDRSKALSVVFDPSPKDRQPVSLDTKEGFAYLTGAYDGEIQFADAEIGRILDRLQQLGLREKTILMITADHGEALAEDGKTRGHTDGVTSSELLHVPLILSGPGIPKGKRVKPIVQNADIVPSLVDLLGLKTDAHFDGKSFRRLIDEPDGEPLHRYALFKSRYGRYNEDEPTILAVHDGQFTYEFNPYTKEEHLWKAPDILGSRHDALTENRDGAAAARAWIGAEIAPARQKYEALPRSLPQCFTVHIAESIDKGLVSPEDAWNEEDSPTDGKWSISGACVQCEPWSEEVAPLSVKIPVPNGTYTVMMILVVGKKEGHPASAVSFRAGDDKEAKSIRPSEAELANLSPGGSHLASFDVGKYAVIDGFFHVVLAPGDPEWWTQVKSFRFTRTDASASEDAVVEQQQLEGQLEALGYLK